HLVAVLRLALIAPAPTSLSTLSLHDALPIFNCSCQDVEMDGNRIVSVTGWQLTTYCYHRVYAALFADCSGDSVLAPLTGAQFRIDRKSTRLNSSHVSISYAVFCLNTKKKAEL